MMSHFGERTDSIDANPVHFNDFIETDSTFRPI